MRLYYTSDLGKRTVFGMVRDLPDTPYLLTTATGIHGITSNPFLQTAYGQDGALLTGAQLQPREFTLGGFITRGVAENRIELLSVMNPRVSGYLLLERGNFRRTLRCTVIRAPYFNAKRGDTFQIDFVAANPYWRQADDTQQDIASVVPMFEWPLDIPAEGISFGERTTNPVVSVQNDGEATVGMLVRFIARGSGVTNPRIYNELTGEQLRMNLTMVAGDVIDIHTGYGEKRVICYPAGGDAYNGMHLLEKTNLTFLQLAPGTTLLHFDADSAVDLLDISIYFSPGYLGV